MNWFILGAYVVTFALLGLEVVLLLRRKKKLETQA
jgi:multisubunit Na+/H+ antiporter MnhC subunit